MEEELTEKGNNEKIGQNQVYDIVTGRQADWQTIIYDLVHTEQLDPWDIDIIVLTARYFEKIYELEEQSGEEMDFYLSSKVLLAAALLLRIKSDILLNKHIKSIDEILFGKKDENKAVIERIEIDVDELPLLIPKTPMPRQRKVTLNELMAALDTAINTENRRIKREVAVKRAKKLSEVDFPDTGFRRVDLKDRIKQFYARILTSLKKSATSDKKHMNKVGYSQLAGNEREQKLACFLPVLHLSNTKKLWVEQEQHLDEIWIYLHEYFNKNKDLFLEELEEDIEEMKEELESEIEEGENLDKQESPLDRARKKREEKKRLAEEAKKELMEELGTEIEGEIKNIDKEQKIEDITGFGQEVE